MTSGGDRPQVELFSALQSLYQSREYADFTIITRDGLRHPVHRAILCPRSRFFAHAVKEGRQDEVTLSDDSPETIHLMIEYLYLLDYAPQVVDSVSGPTRHDSSSSNSETQSVRTDVGLYGNIYGTSAVSAFGGPSRHRGSVDTHSYSTVFGHGRERPNSSLTVHAIPGQDISTFGGPATSRSSNNQSRPKRAPSSSPLATREPHLSLHATVYAVGEKYGVAGLKALALDKFKIQLTKHWDSTEFAEAIHIVFHSTPSTDKDMREAVADAIDWHGRLLDKPEIEVAIMEINGLAYELLKRAKRAEPEYE